MPGQPSRPKPAKYLAKLEAEYRAEELKARIRTQKMMSQGFTYSQVAQAQAPAHVAPRRVDPAPAPAPAQAPAPAPAPDPDPALAQVVRVVRTALTPDKAIAIFEETVEQLRLR
jgi:hypothetical protein